MFVLHWDVPNCPHSEVQLYRAHISTLQCPNYRGVLIGVIDYMRADSAIGFLIFFEGVKISLT